MKTKMIRGGIAPVLALIVWLFLAQSALCFYDASAGRWLSRDPFQEKGGPNPYTFALNDSANDVDMLGLLPAAVVTVDYRGHGTAERNDTPWQYISVDDAIKGQVPLTVTTSKRAASITGTLDDSFNADIRAWTMLSRDESITKLQLSTFLAGGIKVCCPCPFKRTRARWTVSAALSGTAGLADARFDNNMVVTAWNRPTAFRGGIIVKELNSSYCATFTFQLGQGWSDSSKGAPTISHVNVHARFECSE